MTIHKFQTDEARQAEALDKVEKIIERSTCNMDRYEIWPRRVEQAAINTKPKKEQ